MPNGSTIWKWRAEHEDFSKHYAESCNTDADIEFDALIDIADNATSADVQVAKLKIDTRKWTLSKRMPKKYGDYQHLELTGKDGKPLSVVVYLPDNKRPPNG